MLEKDRLVKALIRGSEEDLKDVKFFLGENRCVTQESVCKEAAKAFSQITLGQASFRTTIDKELPHISVSKFLS